MICCPLSRCLQSIDMRRNWKRLLWVIFIACYTSLFFFNFFQPFDDSFFVYVYTMLLVFWLCVEYFQKHLFFQSGLLLNYHWTIRAVFALLFYSSFIIGLSTTIWWQSNKIGLYPFINIIGIFVLGISIILRQKFYLQGNYTLESAKKFYLTLYLLLISLALGYGSLFLLGYIIVLGFPLILAQTIYEKRNFHHYESIIISVKTYHDLQRKYLEIVQKHAPEKKRGKK